MCLCEIKGKDVYMDRKRIPLTDKELNAVIREQEKIKRECENKRTYARRCPYCNFLVEVDFQGFHGYKQAKCDNCGNIVYFSPVKFRRR